MEKAHRTRRAWRLFAAGLCCYALSGPGLSAEAAVRCLGRVKSNTAAIESPTSFLKRGETWGPVTQVRVNKKTGQMTYCAHGDYCYPSSSIEVSACVINAKPSYDDGDEWFFDPS